jgi:hypothetical protein
MKRLAFKSASPVNWASPSYSLSLWKVLLAALLSFGTNTAHADMVLPEPFIEALGESGLVFDEAVFQAFENAPVAENPDMDYELAVRSTKIPLEIRYAIRRWDPSPKEPNVDLEAMKQGVFDPVLLNIAKWTGRGSKKNPMILNSAVFGGEDVRTEFNADWGETALVVPREEWARGFDRCMIVFTHKQRTHAFAFYLFNNKDFESAMAELGPVFYALRFR